MRDLSFLSSLYVFTLLNNSISNKIQEFIKGYLNMNVWTFLTHLVCSLIIISVITLWVWKPTNEFIDENKKKLDRERQKLVLNTRETKYFLGVLKKERNELFNLKRDTEVKAKEEAEKIILDAKMHAEMSAENIRKDAEDRIRVMEEKAKEHIKGSVVKLSLELTEKLISANLNDENNKAIIDAYIKDLEDRKISSEKTN